MRRSMLYVLSNILGFCGPLQAKATTIVHFMLIIVKESLFSSANSYILNKIFFFKKNTLNMDITEKWVLSLRYR